MSARSALAFRHGSRTEGAASGLRPVPADALRNDTLLAAALLVAAFLSGGLWTVAGLWGEDAAALPWLVPYAVGVAAPLALRRRYPSTVFVVISLTFFLGGSFQIPETYVGNICLFIAMYTVGAWLVDRRRAAAVRIIVTIGMFVWLLITTFQAATAPTEEGLSREGLFSPFVAFMLIQFLVNIAFFGGAAYMGDRAYAAAQERLALQERTAELEQERQVSAAQAVALDRVRIARELHDVVAHHVSAMGVQAGAARTVLARDPARAEEILTGVEASARGAITELRQLLQTLRSGEPETDTGASTLSLAALPALVQHAEQNGLPTTFTVVGDPFSVPDTIQVNMYRIAQEALTNARRHAGPHATADVRLRYAPDEVELEVTNTGRVPLGSRPGLGLVGMRERATASGGSIELTPRPRGGFLVRLTVPIAPFGVVGGHRAAESVR